LVFRNGRITGHVVSVDRRGVPTTLLSEPRDYMFPALSPEGKRLAITIGISTITSDTWMFNTETGALTRLTQGGGERPEWTPDGKNVLTVRSDSSTRVVTQPWDGSGAPTLYAEAKVPIWEISLPSQHAGFLAARVNAGGPKDIWIAPVDSPRALRPFVATEADETGPSVSPDGRWVAYVSNESGRYEVYLRAMPSGPRVQISTNGAIEPLWSPTGRELFYRANGKIMAASITWQNGTPRVQRQALFNDVYRSNANAHRTYTVMPDGSGFVFVQAVDTDAKGVVVLNWAEEVRQKVNAATSQ
jgi:Tol biopolymer transport system component